jgi:phosphomannomutase
MTDKILVGRDVRTSSPEIFAYLTKGITDAGAHVYDIGLSTTPMLYYATVNYNFLGSVMITASHNPREYNGLKISGPGAMPIGYDNGLKDLEQMVENEEIVVSPYKGEMHKLNVKEDYINFLRQNMVDFRGMRIGIDCSNGMSALLIKYLFGKFAFYLNDEMDGNFPGHEPNPLQKENVVEMQNLVKEKNLDIGVVFDGDADRAVFVDDRGRYIQPDLIIALLGYYYFDEKKIPGGKVLQDIRSSRSVAEFLHETWGDKVQIHTWRVGRAYAVPKMKELNAVYGGELAGHYYMSDFFHSDSGILAALHVMKIVRRFKEQGIKISEVIDKINKYYNSGEINMHLEDKQTAMLAVVKHFLEQETPKRILDFDGYRLDYDDWWFNIRPSNTEPYLRFIVEANDEALMKEKVEQIKEILYHFKKRK